MVSVGVVGPLDYLVKGRSNDPAVVFEEELALCKPLQERVEGAEIVHPIRVLKDFTYAATRIAGDGWVLAGDAFGFIDPIYSSGVFLARKGGELAADSILAGFETDDFSAAQLGKHGPELVAGIDALRKLVYAFYDRGFSFGKLLRKYPEWRGDLTDCLIGHLFRDFGPLFEAVGEFADLPQPLPHARPLVSAV